MSKLLLKCQLIHQAPVVSQLCSTRYLTMKCRTQFIQCGTTVQHYCSLDLVTSHALSSFTSLLHKNFPNLLHPSFNSFKKYLFYNFLPIFPNFSRLFNLKIIRGRKVVTCVYCCIPWKSMHCLFVGIVHYVAYIILTHDKEHEWDTHREIWDQVSS